MTQLSLRMASSFPESTDGLCLGDARGRILHLNPAAEAILGVPLERVQGEVLCSLLCDRLSGPELSCSASHCPLRRRSSARTSIILKGRYRPRGGGADIVREDVDLRVRCMRAGGSRESSGAHGLRLAVVEDISTQSSHERQKEDWRSMIVHDLRAPLTNFHAGLRAIQEDLSEQPPRLPDEWILDICLRNCGRMLEMLDVYLDVARFDAGLMPVDLCRVELAALVRKGVEEQSFLAAQSHVAVSAEVPPGLAAWADSYMLRRTFQNLLDNALKFSPKNGRVDISAGHDDQGRVTLSIRDMGPGIPPQDVPRVLERYRQAGAAGHGAGAGVGLGLSFCRQAVAAMGGQISVRSRPRAGSLFTLHLPDAAVAARRRARKHRSAPRRPS